MIVLAVYCPQLDQHAVGHRPIGYVQSPEWPYLTGEHFTYCPTPDVKAPKGAYILDLESATAAELATVRIKCAKHGWIAVDPADLVDQAQAAEAAMSAAFDETGDWIHPTRFRWARP